MGDLLLQEEPLYIEDTKLVSLVRENGSVAIGNNGHVYTSKSPFDSSLQPILSELKKSETAFDGEFFGVAPKVIKVKQELINNHLQLLLSIGSQEAVDITQSDAAEAVVRLHQEALDRGASDIHIQLRDDETLISFRIDGDLEFIRTQPIAYGIEFASYAGRTLGELTNYSVSADKADARYDLTLDVEDEDNKKVMPRKTSWRFSQIPTTHQAKIVIRKLASFGSKTKTCEELGLEKGQIELVKKVIEGQGGFFITGPTGSGKTTLINSILQFVPETRSIHTLEDPPEWPMMRFNESQTSIDELFEENGTKPRSFRTRGVQLLRQDTDVVFYGETREYETAANFFRMAETGQLCVGTMHTNGSVASVSTLTQQLGISKYQVAAPGALKALGHTRLAKLICQEEGCHVTYEEALKRSESGISKFDEKIKKIRQLNIDTSNVKFPVKGNMTCPHCKGRGEKGRSALFEIVIVDAQGRQFIQNEDLEGWLVYLKADLGWKSLADHGRLKIERGLMDVDAVASQVDGLMEVQSDQVYKDVLEG